MIILNEEQQDAFNKINDFVDNGNVKDEYFTLIGKAGTGKTVLLSKVVEERKNRNFIVAAIAHKAKDVLRSKIASSNVEAMTVAKLLGMTMDVETGEFKEDPFEKEIPIDYADIVIIDEASMFHQDSINYVMERKSDKCVVIFAGDQGQIPPITSNKSKKKYEISPVFKSKNTAHLINRVRQGEGNPILNHSDKYWENTKLLNPDLTNIEKDSEIVDKGYIIYSSSLKEIISILNPLFKKSINDKNTDFIKIVCYTNSIRRKINDAVRSILFENSSKQFNVGELMIMQDNYKATIEGFNSIDNSKEFIVIDYKIKKTPILDDIFDYYSVRGQLNNGQIITIPVLAEFEQERFNKFVSNLFSKARLESGKKRNELFTQAWNVKNSFASAEYGYCISAHKSQGSTYEHVVVYMEDMLNSRKYNMDQEVSALIYTGMTRASKGCIMISKDFKSNSHLVEHIVNG